MRYISICLYTYMIKDWIIKIKILPGIQCYTNGRRNTAKSHTLAGRAKACAYGLKNKNNPVCAIDIQATEIYIKIKIECRVEIYFIAVPYTAALCECSRCNCIAITIILCSRTIQYVLRKRNT